MLFKDPYGDNPQQVLDTERFYIRDEAGHDVGPSDGFATEEEMKAWWDAEQAKDEGDETSAIRSDDVYHLHEMNDLGECTTLEKWNETIMPFKGDQILKFVKYWCKDLDTEDEMELEELNASPAKS